MILGYLPAISLKKVWYVNLMVWFYTRVFVIIKRGDCKFLRKLFPFYSLNSLFYGDDVLTPDYVARDKVRRLLLQFGKYYNIGNLLYDLLPAKAKCMIPKFIRSWLLHKAFAAVDLQFALAKMRRDQMVL